MWISNVTCNGTEQNLLDCDFDDRLHLGNCSRSPKASVVCYNDTGKITNEQITFHIQLKLNIQQYRMEFLSLFSLNFPFFKNFKGLQNRVMFPKPQKIQL